MQVARGAADCDEEVTLTDFLHIMRTARHRSRRAMDEESRREAAAAGESLAGDKAYKVVQADCRRPAVLGPRWRPVLVFRM
jgi:hypothetical protein